MMGKSGDITSWQQAKETAEHKIKIPIGIEF